MKLVKISRKLHKWLMLFLGLQFVIWSVTGAYMVIFDIDYIHGDSLVTNHQTSIDHKTIGISLEDVIKKYPDAQNISLAVLIDMPVYRFNVKNQNILLSAKNAELLSPINELMAVKLAKHHYSSDDDILEVALISQNPPFELSKRHLPAYRINFDALGSPSLYISASSGKLVTKRHEFWRLFDWMFRFHVADYEDGEPENLLLFWFAVFGILACLSGLVLTYFRVIKKQVEVS
ncbi:PepSY domain-containing protein [Pseudoalteromonas denitrificans]|uniref:PepSY-associated TM region n=1 Tax=Pseudoalteromonas denitrificans DSM 6059 TaxID=1123010 RepID=A0A1I1IW43_9GAMM|nr:PepSY domain-containing protein [Pseudoalteromonas denitrificans]SFC38548.1 PepSY-associated TM region [Pseudoalteromonas denitrificans DSM 6059]